MGNRLCRSPSFDGLLVYASLTYFWDLYNGNVRKEILIFLIYSNEKCWIAIISTFPIKTTGCKNVETLPRKTDLSCFKSLLVTGLWDIILTSLLPPIQSCSSKFWAWSCIASNFDKPVEGGSQHKIMDKPFMPKYGTVSRVLLQLVEPILLKLPNLRKSAMKRFPG